MKNHFAPDWVKTKEDALKYAAHLYHRLKQARILNGHYSQAIEYYLSDEICKKIDDEHIDIFLEYEEKYQNSANTEDETFNYYKP